MSTSRSGRRSRRFSERRKRACRRRPIDLTSGSQDRLKRAAQALVLELEAVRERLVGQHALATQKQLIGEIATELAQETALNAKQRWPMQPPAKLFGELAIGDGQRRGRIHGS